MPHAWFLGSLMATLLAATLACAGSAGDRPAKPDAKPKAGRLGTPMEVTCTKSGDQLTVAWGKVDDALQYRVYLEVEDGAELVHTVPETSYTHPMSDMSDDPTDTVKAHVRAMRSTKGKDASKPSKPVVCQ